QDWQSALEVQHRRRSLFIAVGLYGQRRRIRDRRLRWRRQRPERRGLDPQLRAAEAVAALLFPAAALDALRKHLDLEDRPATDDIQRLHIRTGEGKVLR